MNRYIRISFVIIQSLFLYAYGQETVQKNIGLEEVQILGKRYLQTAEGALSVDVLTADSIQKYQSGSLMQTLSRLPGVSAIGIGASQSKPQIRGLGFNRVAVVEHGIKHEGQQWGLDHGLEIDQFGVGKAEVIKGANSFMYGSDAIGGVIRLSPPPFLLEDGLTGQVTLLGKSNNATFGSSLQMQGRKKNWVFGAGGTYLNYGDYRVPTHTVHVYNYPVHLKDGFVRNTAGREQHVQLRGGFVSARFSSLIYLSNYHSRFGFFANAHGLEPRGVDTALYDKSHRDILYPSQRINHFKLVSRTKFSWRSHVLDMDLGYQRNHRQEYNNYTAHGYMPAVYPDNLNIPIHLERLYDKNIYSATIKDQITRGAHVFSVGINAEHQHNSIDGWSFLIPKYQQQALGLFIHDQYRLNELTMLYAALRYDRAAIETSAYQDWFASKIENGTSAYVIRSKSLKRAYHSLVWSVGARRQLGQVEAKLNLGKSFRMPTAQELAANGVNYHYFSYEKGNATLRPEASYQVDLSLAWDKDQVAILFTPFYNYFSNYVFLNPTSRYDQFYGAGNQIFEYQESKLRRYGAELKLTYHPIRYWKMELLGEFVDSKQLSGVKRGYTLPFSPAPSLLFDLSWSPKDSRYLKDSYVSMDCKWTARQAHIVPPEEKTDGYQLFNLRAGTQLQLQGSSIQLRLQVQNIFNRKYMEHTSFYRLIALPEQGRNITLSVGIPFGKKSES